MNLKIVTLLFCITAIAPEIALSANNETATEHTPAISFVLPDINGKPHKSNEWDGKVVILNFWATWCPPCIKEIPEFIKLQEKLGGKGLQFVGIALDERVGVEAFIQTHSINYPILIGGLEGSDIAFQYGNQLGVLPFSVIIDRKGRVISRYKGVLKPKKLKEVISPLL